MLFATAHTDLAPRPLAELVRARLPHARPGVVAVASPEGFVVAVNEPAKVSRVSAAALVKLVLDGRGGGNAALAQGKRPADSEATTDRLTRLLAEYSG
ncbi:hypothetical protein ABZ815_38265 [Nonomuraea sp. NPDC047529]|uniref:hypothetical protein n=1 Tax=Nonomuraea sp. NPDC047529 TaxID=3155623 RepID=UPI00340092AF